MLLEMMAAVFIRFVKKENSLIHKKNSVRIVTNLVKLVLQMVQSAKHALMDFHLATQFVFSVEIDKLLMAMYAETAALDA